MRILYFDCFSGISGDMTLAALLDLGIDIDVFRSEMDKLNLGGYELIIEKKLQNSILGMDVQVLLNEEYETLQEKRKQHEKEIYQHVHGHVDHHHSTSHEHHGHHHHHEHPHDDNSETQTHSHSHSGRNLKDIEELIDASDLNIKVKNFSKKVFGEIARAEAKVHNKAVYEVHFHEVGAVDSIVDIVGVAICIDMLGVEKVFSSPLHDGKGFIKCQHGTIPVPVPAVMEMLSNSKIPLIMEDINTELVTPTGMGIIKCLASDFGRMPAMMIEKTGYGMGKRETGKFNALRVVLGSLFEKDSIDEEIAVMETNIDDMSPEVLGYTMESLLENGALDVYYTPIYMKKSRPAVMLSVLSRKTDMEKLTRIIMKETSTLGIRKSIVQRSCMDREIVNVNTEYGDVRVKVASTEGIRKFAPEFEDCREIAIRTGLPILKIYNLVNEQAKFLA